MNNAALKGSVYNVMIEKKDGVAVYNTRTGNLIRAFDDRASTILEALQDTKDIEKMDSNILNVLVDKGILVSDEIDEFAEMERMEIEAKYDGYLHLIILPTEECNFRCIYCYEQFWRGDMSKEVQEGLVNFVEKQIKKIQISYQQLTDENQRRNMHLHLLMSDFAYGKDIRLFNAVSWLLEKFAQVQKFGEELLKEVCKKTWAYRAIELVFIFLRECGTVLYFIVKLIHGDVLISEFVRRL